MRLQAFVARQVVFGRDVQRFLQAFGGVVRAADRAHLAGLDQPGERAERVGERRFGVVEMGLIQVDPLDPEPGERVVAGFRDHSGCRPLSPDPILPPTFVAITTLPRHEESRFSQSPMTRSLSPPEWPGAQAE